MRCNLLIACYMLGLILPCHSIYRDSNEQGWHSCSNAKSKARHDSALLLALLQLYQSDADCRSFSCLHDTVLPKSSKTRLAFQQLRSSGINIKGKKSKRHAAEDASSALQLDAAGRVLGKLLGSITGVELQHLLLLLPSMLFDLMDEQINANNERINSNLGNPASQLIELVLLLLEWYHLYRLCIFTMYYFTLLGLIY